MTDFGPPKWRAFVFVGLDFITVVPAFTQGGNVSSTTSALRMVVANT